METGKETKRRCKDSQRDRKKWERERLRVRPEFVWVEEKNRKNNKNFQTESIHHGRTEDEEQAYRVFPSRRKRRRKRSQTTNSWNVAEPLSSNNVVTSAILFFFSSGTAFFLITKRLLMYKYGNSKAFVSFVNIPSTQPHTQSNLIKTLLFYLVLPLRVFVCVSPYMCRWFRLWFEPLETGNPAISVKSSESCRRLDRSKAAIRLATPSNTMPH